MDVIFEPERGMEPFTIEVSFFDTILEIKEKIQKYERIPVDIQTLVFNGQVIEDDGDVASCQILQNSHIQIKISSQPIQLTIKFRSCSTLLEMDLNADTVFLLKQQVHHMLHPPIPFTLLRLESRTGTEILRQDRRSLRYYYDELMENNCEITVKLRPLPSLTVQDLGAALGSSNTLYVFVMWKTKWALLEVEASDNVDVLRNEVKKLHREWNFPLPQEGYSFLYKQNVMKEDRSFEWHNVGHSDTIMLYTDEASEDKPKYIGLQ